MPEEKKPFFDFSDVSGGSSSTAPTPPAEQPPPPRTHTVVQGDSLSKIAKAYYGSFKNWRAIYEANVDVIGKNPDLIKPGQVLVIPEA